MSITGNTATGTLKYLDTGDLVTTWGAGNFIALKWQVPEDATSLLVGMNPSAGSGLVEAIDDPDRNGVFKVTDKNSQYFRMVVTTPTDGSITTDIDLSALTCEKPTYTQQQLEAMTKQQISDLATSLGYTIDSTKTKAEMIAEFLSQQN